MPPVSEPSAADVASVQAMLDGSPQPAPAPAPTPAPQPAPAPAPAQPAPQQQPAQPTPQPTPSAQPQGDPFESLFATAPTEVVAAPPAAPPAPAQPTEPVAPQPTQPTEPVPTPQPQQPVETPQPAPVQPPNAPVYQSYDDFMADVLGDTTPTPLPDHSKIAPDDEVGIKNFFDELVNTAVARAEQKVKQQNALQTTERQLWDSAFDKYGSLKSNKKLRDMVHNIRMGEFRRGVALTPTQAADQLLDALKQQYNRGVADNTVVTTIESTQPTGGGSGQPVPTSLDRENVLTAVQTGGEAALTDYLDAEIKAGRM